MIRVFCSSQSVIWSVVYGKDITWQKDSFGMWHGRLTPCCSLSMYHKWKTVYYHYQLQVYCWMFVRPPVYQEYRTSIPFRIMSIGQWLTCRISTYFTEVRSGRSWLFAIHNPSFPSCSLENAAFQIILVGIGALAPEIVWCFIPAVDVVASPVFVVRSLHIEWQ